MHIPPRDNNDAVPVHQTCKHLPGLIRSAVLCSRGRPGADSATAAHAAQRRSLANCTPCVLTSLEQKGIEDQAQAFSFGHYCMQATDAVTVNHRF